MFCTERETRLIYEAQCFEDCVLVRPVSKGIEPLVERIGYTDFDKRFEEFAGNPELVYDTLNDNPAPTEDGVG